MKTLQLILLTLLLLTSFTPILADQDVVVDQEIAEEESQPIIEEDTEKKTVVSKNSYFKLELIRGVQNSLTKKIPYTLYITPEIDSEKTQILWEVPSTLIADSSHKEFADLQKDQVYKFKVNIDPQRQGTYDVTANVIAWKHDTNYTNSVSSTVTLSKNLVVQPVDSEYTVSIILFVALILIIAGIGIFLLYKGSDKIVKRIRIWLTPPY